MHVDKKAKQNVTQIIEKSFNDKNAKNSSDYRKSLLIVSSWFIENMESNFVSTFLKTLTEIQEILYMTEDNRTTTTVLRLHVSVFLHALHLKINVRGNLKKLTSRKFFGSYYHSLMRHAPLQYRIISGRSVNTEKEEATFSTLKKFAKLTSNHHSNQVSLNILKML